jgi:hypothetical protein
VALPFLLLLYDSYYNVRKAKNAVSAGHAFNRRLRELDKQSLERCLPFWYSSDNSAEENDKGEQ